MKYCKILIISVFILLVACEKEKDPLKGVEFVRKECNKVDDGEKDVVLWLSFDGDCSVCVIDFVNC
jgi:hypothetical protein